MTAFLRRLLSNPSPSATGDSLGKGYGDDLKNADALINRANKRAVNGNLEGALADFDDAIALNPSKATAFFNRGVFIHSLGKFEAAIQDFSAAIALLPDYDEAYYHRGNNYRQLGQFQQAIQDYTQAIRLNPYCIKAYYQRADSRAELGDHPGALADYSQVILRVPKDANAYCQRGIFLSQSGELAKAVEDFTAAIERNPRLADAYFYRGYCWAQLGDAQKASQDFSKTLLHDPNHQAAHTRAYALGMLKETSPALPNRQTLLPARNGVETPYTLGTLKESIAIAVELAAASPTTENRTSLSKTLPLESTSLEHWFAQAQDHHQLGDLESAIADYSQIIQQDPHNTQAYYQRSQTFRALGKTEAAMKDLNQAIHWARAHSLELMRHFSRELSTTLKALKQDLAEWSEYSPLVQDAVQPLPTTSSPPQTLQSPELSSDRPSSALPPPSQQPHPHSPHQPLHAPPPPPLISVTDVPSLAKASLPMGDNQTLAVAVSPIKKPCTHAGNSPGNQFCIHCGESLNILSRYSNHPSRADDLALARFQAKPAVTQQQQRLKQAEGFYNQGLVLCQQGNRQESLRALSTSLKIFLEQREMRRYQQTLHLMQDVAHALNDPQKAEPKDNLTR